MVYVFGDCELDTRRCELRRGGEARHVEPQVFDVLRHLIEHREQLVPANELLDTIWGHRFVAPATLNSRIKAARQAIGDDGAAQRLIRTVRGRGFRFVAEVALREGSGGSSAPPPAARDSAPRPAATPDAASPAPALVGRAEELARLEALLEDARHGVRRVALLAGEAGVGKSTLVDAFVARVRADGAVRVASGQCLDRRGAGEPYLPLLDALGRLGRERPGGDEVVSALESCAPTWLIQLPALLSTEQLESAQRRAFGATRERMLRELVEGLELLSRDTPLLLVLEDLHWSDPSTLDFLAWVVQRPEPARLLVLGTFRPGEAGDDLTAAVATSRRTHAFTQLPLDPWSAAELREHLARALPGHALPEALVALLHARTEGNPLFVQTLLDAWGERGLLDEGAALRPDALEEAAAGIPETLRLLVEQRLERASPEDRCVLEAASAAGVEFDAAAVAAALDVGPEEVEDRCAALARRGQLLGEAGIAEWPDGTWSARFRFGHQLFQEILYARLPPSRRARVHRALGARLEAGFGEAAQERAGELALHFRLGRDDERAIRYLRLAAEQAMRRSAHREAAQHLGAAIELLRRHPELPDTARLELELLQRLAPALLVTRGWGDPDAERAYARAHELSRRLDEPALLARALYGLAYLHEIRGNYRDSEAVLEERLRLDLVGREPRLLGESHELLSCSLFHQGEFARALEHANQARQALDGACDGEPPIPLGDNAAVACHYWAGLAHWFLGFPDRALVLVRYALERAAGDEHAYVRATAEIQMARLHQLRREPALVAEHAGRGVRIAEEHGYPYHAAVAATLAGWARAQAGDAGGGIEQVRGGLEMQRRIGADMERPYCLALLADACLLADRLDESHAAIEEALAGIGARARTFFWEAELYRLRGELRSRAEAHEAATRDVESALDVAVRQGSPMLELRAAISLWRHGRSPRRATARRRVAEVYARFSEGLDTSDLREARALLEARA